MLRVVEARDLTSGWNDLEIHRELLGWARAYKADPTGLRSLAVVFSEPGGLDEPAFEQALWARIQSLADKDAWKGMTYDPRVCAETDNPPFRTAERRVGKECGSKCRYRWSQHT